MGDVAATDRFELRGQVGAGSMGSVYRVLDRMRGHEVALKALRAIGPTALYRFKREFRELCDLTHPNLVALHELYAVGDEWMFTMELVDGVSFKDWVRADPARLRPALIQLADGLTALHVAGKVHRDLKPSNVLVTPEGRVVILDFGLVADPDAPDRTHDGTPIGTPGYMSPEQAADVPLTAATDWYSFGTILYEALTGRKPFAGTSTTVLLDKQRFDPHPPHEYVPDVPADLDALAMALLARDPRRRPDGPAVLAALGSAPSPWTKRIADRAARHDLRQSRAEELTALHRALADSRDHTVIVLIDGRRGAGRTALLDAFADELAAAGEAVVFTARISRREDVPFSGLDQIVDGITRYLAAAPPEEAAELLPDDLEGLARMFPTLQRLRAARLPDLTGRPRDPAELGERAFAAAAEMLMSIARRRPLAIILDDIEWGSPVAAEITLRLVRDTGAPPVLFACSYATEHADSPTVRGYTSWEGDLRRITLR